MVKFYLSSRKSEILHFEGLLLSKACTVSAKKVQKSYPAWHWRVMQSLKKNWLVLSKWHKEFGNFSPNHLKVWQVHFEGLFLSKVQSFELKQFRGVIFHDTEQWCRIRINFDLVVSKLAWRIEWTFIKAYKCLKIFTLMGFFCRKHNVSARKFQRNYVSWHWKVMHNVKENWLVPWKMT